jgi:hypothetical protein
MEKILVREGFRILQTRVELPLEYADLQAELQTELLICYLFINDGRSVEGIARLGLDRRLIVGALLRQGVIQDRRQGRMDTVPEASLSEGKAKSQKIA